MAGANVGCADNAPLDVVAELVEVADDLIKAETQMPADVLKHGELGPHDGERVTHVGPEVPVVILPHASAGGTEWLAGVTAGDDVDRLDRRPVHVSNVPKIWGLRVAVGEDFAGADGGVSDPRRLRAKHGLDGHI